MHTLGVGATNPGRQYWAGALPDQLVLASDGTVWGNNAQILDLKLPALGPGRITGVAIYAGSIWF
jgi:hypothetical protein